MRVCKVLLKTKGKSEHVYDNFQGRGSVVPWAYGKPDEPELPGELQGKCILVSGHHGHTWIKGDRFVIDGNGPNNGVGGGKPNNPMEALILRSDGRREIVNSAKGKRDVLEDKFFDMKWKK